MNTVPPVNVVYGLSAEDGVIRYVGLTTRNARVRLGQHLGAARRNSHYPVAMWIRKHGEASIRIRVLEVCPGGMVDLNAAEMRWIAHHQTFVTDGGVNCTRGGDGVVGQIRSVESRAKMSKMMKGRVISPEARSKSSATQKGKKGRPMTPENVAKLSERMAGREFTQEHKAKLSKALEGNQKWVGRSHSEESRSKMSATKKGKPVYASHIRWCVGRDIVKPGCPWCNGSLSIPAPGRSRGRG